MQSDSEIDVTALSILYISYLLFLFFSKFEIIFVSKNFHVRIVFVKFENLKNCSCKL